MADDLSRCIRRTVHFSGHVQGVGFRYTAQSIASGLGAVGLVRNLPDGRVELIAEGTLEELDRLQQAVTDAMRSNVSDVAVTAGTATGEFGSFRIAF